MRRALVVSPTPSHPADYGHRNRVFQTTALLAASGYAIDFLLYPMDDDWRDAIPPGLAEMQAAWGRRRGGSVMVVPPTRPLHAPPVGRHHGVDEWWDPALDAQLEFLCRRRAYDVMLVNYVFLSRALLHGAPRCRRVLDTHDCLSGRRELFERHGAAPEFFFTTEAEEARGLGRADIVLAIKQSEAERFRQMTARRVITLPFYPRRGTRRRPARGALDAREKLRVGFIGADNSVNAINLAAFLTRLAIWQRVYLPHLEMIVAGNVCRRIAAPPEFVTLLGRVEDARSFYDAIDVVVAPLAFSTGLKIKVAEALGRGLPVVATADAFDGFAPADPYHSLQDIDAVCAALVSLAADRNRLVRLARATAAVAVASRKIVAAGVAALRSALGEPARAMAVVTDLDPAARSTLAEERCWQAVAYFSHLVEVRVQGGLPAAEDLPRLAGVWLDLPGAPPGLRSETHEQRRARPPLRFLPPVLGWSPRDDEPPLALVVVEEACEPEERATRDILARAVSDACRSHRVALLRTADVARDAVFLATLAVLPRPHAVVGIDLGWEARDLLGCLAGLAGAAFFPLGDPYPLLAEGAPRPLVGNLREHMAALSAWLRAPSPCGDSALTSDAGWSLLWARLSNVGVAGASHGESVRR